MKITSLETYLVPPRWVFLRIDTDEGITGWGEPVVEGRAETVRRVVELSDTLIGADPLRIEDHWQRLTKGGFYRGGPVLSSAVAGIDQALWDIAGKALGVPVYELLGGPVRERVRMYALDRRGQPRRGAPRPPRAQVEAGFTAVKMNGGGRMARLRPRPGRTKWSTGLPRCARPSARTATSSSTSTAGCPRRWPAGCCRCLNRSSRCSSKSRSCPSTAATCAASSSAAPCPSPPVSGSTRAGTSGTCCPPASPSPSRTVCHAGGISEIRRIAAMAETYDVSLAPHCPSALSRSPPACRSPSRPRTC